MQIPNVIYIKLILVKIRPSNVYNEERGGIKISLRDKKELRETKTGTGNYKPPKKMEKCIVIIQLYLIKLFRSFLGNTQNLITTKPLYFIFK